MSYKFNMMFSVMVFIFIMKGKSFSHTDKVWKYGQPPPLNINLFWYPTRHMIFFIDIDSDPIVVPWIGSETIFSGGNSRYEQLKTVQDKACLPPSENDSKVVCVLLDSGSKFKRGCAQGSTKWTGTVCPRGLSTIYIVNGIKWVNTSRTDSRSINKNGNKKSNSMKKIFLPQITIIW